MGNFQLQDRLGLLIRAPIDYSSRVVAQKASPLVFIIVVLIHLLLIIIVLNSKFETRESFPFERTIQLVQLQPEKNIAMSEPEKPTVDFKTYSTHLIAPTFSIKDTNNSKLDLSLPQSDSFYELPDETAGQYKDVFDPKLRKKLIDAQVYNVPRKKEKPTSWTESDGRVFIDMGNGECIVSMQKMDSRERGTNWGFTRCGKTDSEKMIDNINADLEARKHPLKVQ